MTNSFLKQLFSYWAGNTALNTALPQASKVWTDLAPEDAVFPYCTISVISTVPTYTTCKTFVDKFTFQVSIWDTSLSNCEALALIVDNNLNLSNSITNMTCYRVNSISRQDNTAPLKVFNVVLTYDLFSNNSV